MGTSRKRVSWAEYADVLEASSPEGGGEDGREEADALARGRVSDQGRGQAGAGRSGSLRERLEGASTAAAAASASGAPSVAPLEAGGEVGSPKFEDIAIGAVGVDGSSPALSGPGPSSASAAAGARGGSRSALPRDRPGMYRLRLCTADRSGAGLGSTSVSVEVLGTGLSTCQQLPAYEGTFQRGSVDKFRISLEEGKALGEVLAIKVSSFSGLGDGRCYRRWEMGSEGYHEEHELRGGWVHTRGGEGGGWEAESEMRF
jgi:hypothetical protein